jgi:DNA polymerase-3 subunit delta'
MLIGHQKQWQFLIKSAEIDRLSHAYLFSGQSHLGKKTLAKEFIKLLNCQDHKNRPCQSCWSCRAINREIHPDLILIKPEGKEIKISQIRELQRLLSFRPHSSLYKAAILEKGEKMNPEAQSCLLKTLEEPSAHTLLFLITEYPERLFPTILSRVQKIKFFPVAETEIEQYLKSQRLSLTEIERIISFSFGRPGLALEFSQNPQKLEKEYQKIKEMNKVFQLQLPLRFQYVKDLVSQKEDLKEILESWLRYFREILRLKMGLEPELKILASQNFDFSLPQLKKIINSIEKINFLISSTNINQRLALEILMLHF